MQLLKNYKHKIKTREKLLDVIGKRPRAKKVIMCHGVFDIVHPGHMRHLLYAKSKADLLVVTLTADKHINKGTYRPHIPQELRATNLAAYEFVDYVVIDKNEKPLDNIAFIQPDMFAKGYEYVADGMPVKTSEEADIVESYGGEMVFTPGDIVFSSSKFIEAAPPKIRTEKLLALMDRDDFAFKDLRDCVRSMGKCRVHVVGDTIVDTITETTLIGGQTKTPTISVKYDGHRDYVGGAGIVAMHLKAAGTRVVFSTVLGDDKLKDFVLDGLRSEGIECKAIISDSRPTTQKNVIVANTYRLLKVDTLDNRCISDKMLQQLSDNIRSVKADAVVFSDFRHGIFNNRTIPLMISSLPNKVFRVADSQVASRWGNITEFKGFDLLTPNEREARFALGDQDTGVRPMVSKLYDAAQCKTLIMKMGDRGVLACRSSQHEALDSFCVVDSFVDNLVDPVGAGDALLAYSTLAMMHTGNVAISTIIGSIAAACECERDGNIPIRPEYVMDKIDVLEKQTRFSR